MRLRTAHRHRDRATNHGKRLGKLLVKANSGRPLTQWEVRAYHRLIAIGLKAISEAAHQVVEAFREGLIPAIQRFTDRERARQEAASAEAVQ